MAISRRMAAYFGLGLLLVCSCFIKAAATDDEITKEDLLDFEEAIHAVNRPGEQEGCRPSEMKIDQECRVVDSYLHEDADDVYNVRHLSSKPVSASWDDASNHTCEEDDDDIPSPHVRNNLNIIVMGH